MTALWLGLAFIGGGLAGAFATFRLLLPVAATVPIAELFLEMQKSGELPIVREREESGP